MTFNKIYFWVFLLIFIIEIGIGAFVKDSFVRPFVGDALVVILIYSFFQIFLSLDTKSEIKKLTISVFLFACLIETGQYFNLIDLLGLGHIQLARVVIGTSFSWWDIVSYLVGALFILLIEYKYVLK